MLLLKGLTMLRAHLKITRETADHRIEVVADQPSRSFLLQFPSLMARQWLQANDTCKDTAGQNLTTDEVELPFHATSFGGYGRGLYSSTGKEIDADGQGICVGTDGAAVQPDQFSLISQIRSGEIANTVMYCGTYLYGLTINATTDEAHFHVAAVFQNISGGSLNVNEVGIYANGGGNNDDYPNQQQYCIARDVVSTIALADAEFLRVEYTLSIAT
jgi:hypothetical protein